MEIAIAELKPGANHFEAEEDWQSLELPPVEFPAAITIRSLADLEGRLLTVRHHLLTTAQLTCDRCLRQFSQSIDLDERFIFAIDPRSEYDDDVIVVQSEEQLLPLNQNLREMLLLTLPLQKLCRDDCQGLCPLCGSDLNQAKCDCRLAPDNSLKVALKQLKERS
ncbi:MAG: DUF177 domain-containing protein [Candidatus Delongbacteria bacterium]|nr:DUF177 domain-containing protein [Candidatus Delongbacteria bacterium]